MTRRRPGLQRKWGYVVNSLQEIILSYEEASSIISLYADRWMRARAVSFAVRKGSLVLDLGAGPGVMSRLVESKGGEPVLLDVSQAMLSASQFPNRVRGTFEFLPFRTGVFDSAVSGFALRDAHDLYKAIGELARTIKPGGRFSFCDLGKPDSRLLALLVAFYLRTMPAVIGLATAGRPGVLYGSIFDTYILAPHNSELKKALSLRFKAVDIKETQLGGSIVAECVKRF